MIKERNGKEAVMERMRKRSDGKEEDEEWWKGG
jgi:hypothetical protein